MHQPNLEAATTKSSSASRKRKAPRNEQELFSKDTKVSWSNGTGVVLGSYLRERRRFYTVQPDDPTQGERTFKSGELASA
jgi:hypothetical protein